MKLISLTQGQVTSVEDERFGELNQHKWCALRTKNGRFYAVRNIYPPSRMRNSRGVMVRMHRIIVGALPDQKVDHVDNDGLNNVDDNLRVCTPQQNAQNRPHTKFNKSGFKGVIFYPNLPKPYKVSIMANKVLHHIGYFTTDIEGAIAYDEAARRLHGEFAYQNLPTIRACAA